MPPRVLSMIERTVPEAHRDEYLRSIASRRDDAAAQNVRFWIFENNDEPGRFVEFTEAASADALIALAHGELPAPLWREVTGG